MARSRIVVTGMGAVTPVGNTAADSWHAVCAGTSGIKRISRFDTTGFAVQIAGEVKGLRRAAVRGCARGGGWTASRNTP